MDCTLKMYRDNIELVEACALEVDLEYPVVL